MRVIVSITNNANAVTWHAFADDVSQVIRNHALRIISSRANFTDRAEVHTWTVDFAADDASAAQAALAALAVRHRQSPVTWVGVTDAAEVSR